MEEYFEGLRKIRKKRKTIELLSLPFWYCLIVFGLLSAGYKPFVLLESALIFFGYFIYSRYAFSKCPRCGHRYFNFFNILTYYCYFIDIFGTQCAHCHLKMSELPEVELYKVQNNDKEWKE